ncbi:MAG: BMP family ABC transporter substrate-binding protein, partial [Pseudomonadales bacterium]|nr:BMP family ABC transporter substrate-binding protein [Pseudomonadales bacterium]
MQIPNQFLTMLPYLATIVVLALISRNPAWIKANMPASLDKPFHPGRNAPPIIAPSPLLNRKIAMTDTHKRSLLKLAVLVAMASVLAACDKKDAQPASAAAPANAAPLKVAFAYVGPVGDGGWTFAHDNARKAIEKEFGERVQTSFVENVPEGADAERVLRDMVGQGNRLVFGNTFGYMEPMLKVAADHPEVMFE